MKFTFIILFSLLFSCNTQDHKTASNTINKLDTLKLSFIGRWGGLGENTPVWKIKADSIYYYEENKAYPYRIEGEDLIIDRQGTKIILRKIIVNVDTLSFIDDQGLVIKGFRFK